MLNEFCTGQYVGKTICGFIHSHDYSLQITQSKYNYTVEAINDLTDEKPSSAIINYASENSLRNNWALED